MNAEELRDTTLDPANRTLLQITMDKPPAGADTMFAWATVGRHANSSAHASS